MSQATKPRFDLMMALVTRKIFMAEGDTPGVELQISQEEAQIFAQKLIGTDERQLEGMIRLGWIRLAQAATPQQKLSYERLITEIAIALGMGRFEAGARFHAENTAEKARAKALATEAADLHRWQNSAPMAAVRDRSNV